jgi:hypothetical protein
MTRHDARRALALVCLCLVVSGTLKLLVFGPLHGSEFWIGFALPVGAGAIGLLMVGVVIRSRDGDEH